MEDIVGTLSGSFVLWNYWNVREREKRREEGLLTEAPFTYYRSIIALCDSLIVMATSQRQQGGVHLSQVERLLSYEQLLIVINNEKKYSDIIQQLWTSISNHLLSFIKEVSVCVGLCVYYVVLLLLDWPD